MFCSLLLLHNIPMIHFMLLFGVVCCFKEFSIGYSEICSFIFEVVTEVFKNDMSFQGFINFKLFIYAIKINFEVVQIKVSIFWFKLCPDRDRMKFSDTSQKISCDFIWVLSCCAPTNFLLHSLQDFGLKSRTCNIKNLLFFLTILK